ncbi:MAG: urea carboxylase-associated family protein [Solirubrobacterales bacterium]
MSGALLSSVTVPAREARVVRVAAGQVLEVVDLEGRQVGDLAAWMAANPAEYLSPGHTLSCLTKLVPEEGDEIFSNHRRPLLRILRDEVGTHDLIVPCCDPERYSRDYGLDDHPSCLRSLQAALESEGLDLRLDGEQCWNVFMNNVHEGNRIVTHEPGHGPGAKISMEVLEDLVVALSACPQDLSPCNAYRPTPMELRVLEAP